MQNIKGNQSTSRAINRLLLLNTLRRNGPTSRTDIAAATGLSLAAISYVSSELIEEELIVEREGQRRTEKRKTPQLDLNYSAHLSVGMKLMEDRLHTAITDLGANIIDTLTVPVDAREPAAVADAAAHAVDLLFGKTRQVRTRLIGIGLATPGQYDSDRGICRRCHRFGWQDVNIAKLVGDRTNVPIWADNDVNAFALAEHLFGIGVTSASLAVFSFGRGLGASLVFDEKLLHGRSGGAGEIAHISVVDDGEECECGRRGCLETVASIPAMLRMYSASRKARGDAVSGVQIPKDPILSQDEVIARKLAQLAAAGDPIAVDVLQATGRRLGAAAATLLNLFDPETLVIGGEGVRCGPILLDALLSTLNERNFQPETRIHVEYWGDDAWARGAAALAIESYFSLPHALMITQRA
ncbi:ROK family protein [Rhizobium leguminosarum]|uniref:ROK family protein n=1 Tax=Rhizobium leguminosarum TaxID=384 RepID=UPI001C98DBFA|nr:ROK family protein [Rhizobium leguminosarum]MBY5766973.1 ROK family protein [Rhizobium leguminosarum]